MVSKSINIELQEILGPDWTVQPFSPTNRYEFTKTERAKHWWTTYRNRHHVGYSFFNSPRTIYIYANSPCVSEVTSKLGESCHIILI